MTPQRKKDPRKEALKSGIESYCRELAEAASTGDPSKIVKMLDAYSSAARRWSHNNLVGILAQKPNIGRPVTLREARQMGHFPVKNSTAASIFVPVIIGDLNMRVPENVRKLHSEYQAWIASQPRLASHMPEAALAFVEQHESLGRLTQDKQRLAAAKLLSTLEMVEKTQQSAGKVLRFKVVPCVYDLGVDTEGPEITTATTDTPEKMADLLGALKEFARENGWNVAATRLSLGELGSASAGRIEVGEWLSDPSKIKTLVHELAHQLLHIEQDTTSSRTIVKEIPEGVRELQAEAVAYTVCRHFGIKPDFSAEYIKMFGNGPKEIMENLAVICRTSRGIIQSVAEKLKWEHPNVSETPDATHDVELRYHLGEGSEEQVFEDYQPLLTAIYKTSASPEATKLQVFKAGLGGSFYFDHEMTAQQFVGEMFEEFCQKLREAEVYGFAYNDRGEFVVAPTLEDVPVLYREQAVSTEAISRAAGRGYGAEA